MTEEKKKEDKRQVPLACFAPPEDPAEGEGVLDTFLASSSKNKVSNTTPNLYVSKNPYIKEVLDTLKQPYISTGNLRTNQPTNQPSSLVSTSVLVYEYGNCRPTTVYVPVEMWHQFKLRCLEKKIAMSVALSHLIADWLGGSLRIPVLDTIVKLGQRQLTVSNTTTQICPLTSQPRKPEQCRTCKQAYSCGKTW